MCIIYFIPTFFRLPELMIVNVWSNNSFIIINVLNLFFFVIEKSTEESAARETSIRREDPFRYIAVLAMVKERMLSWMKKQSEISELCPKGMTLCLSLVWPVTFQCALSLFTGLDHAPCPQWICFMDALEFCVNR